MVDYLRAAAEVLDYLVSADTASSTWDSILRCLILDNGWLQITDFGLAQLFWDPAEQDIAQRNARYAAPELFDKKITTIQRSI